MRFLQALFLFFFAAVIANGVNGAPQYASKLDNFDLEPVLANQRILKNYVKCIMEKGPCTPEGKEFRRILPDVLETTCAKCSPSQRKNMRKIVNHLKNNRLSDWKDITNKYDKDSKYTANIEKFAASTD